MKKTAVGLLLVLSVLLAMATVGSASDFGAIRPRVLHSVIVPLFSDFDGIRP